MRPQTSLQLFTIREAVEKDMDGALARVAAHGFSAVEVYDFVTHVDDLAASLKSNGLVAPSGHAFLASGSFVNPDGTGTLLPVPPVDDVFDAAERLGVELVVDPFTETDRWSSIEGVSQIADLLNQAAERGAARGIRVGYHNHAHELEATFNGKTGLEALAGFLDERVVLEVDLYWVARAGVDPVALVKRLGDRVVAVHVKDETLDPEAIKNYPPTDQVPAGAGVVPLAAAIAAAPSIELAIVEFDHYEGDIFDGVEHSRRFLDEASELGK